MSAVLRRLPLAAVPTPETRPPPPVVWRAGWPPLRAGPRPRRWPTSRSIRPSVRGSGRQSLPPSFCSAVANRRQPQRRLQSQPMPRRPRSRPRRERRIVVDPPFVGDGDQQRGYAISGRFELLQFAQQRARGPCAPSFVGRQDFAGPRRAIPRVASTRAPAHAATVRLEVVIPVACNDRPARRTAAGRRASSTRRPKGVGRGAAPRSD